MARLDNKVAIITGGAKGMGLPAQNGSLKKVPRLS